MLSIFMYFSFYLLFCSVFQIKFSPNITNSKKAEELEQGRRGFNQEETWGRQSGKKR